ncbi:ABC transporter substrate-binding protein [Aquibacillus koreensis]|uniref:ABC transporter substrate-binding protein n=1 Tax=Aquibacillus koreensis TaxID=279446 RepID=A0A9X3WJH0_9BACI|nr:ABC transporter substrate-binding protein [Aquibacillus koreensis]MCT2537785.1 ABC transporter substrate-binding protein [Aquibacillus koreensis]MDC3421182.1 ABC transporter substrate-binding protein [Aquibacillus koreensis]
MKSTAGKFIVAIGMLLLLMVIAACGEDASSEAGAATDTDVEETETTETEGETEASEEAVDLGEAKLVTNWFAQPEHGGNYAALKEGYYAEEGIDMTVEPGGPQISATQLVSSGKVEFGYTSGEDILNARDKGIPLVAIGAIFQTSPYVLISHEEAGIEDFSDLNGKTVITAPGVGYWEYIKEAYDLDDVKELSYTGNLATFIDNPDAVTQGYVTSEPFVLDKEGVANNHLLIHDSGFQPYSNVIFTTEKVIEEKPELVKAFMKATVKGWETYREDPAAYQSFLQEYNPDLTTELMDFGAETQDEFVFGGDAAEHGFGYMSEERWSDLQQKMIDLGIISYEEDASNYFTTEFLPTEE